MSSSTAVYTVMLLLISFVMAANSIKCWQCGQYSDGVGSITPCANRSAATLGDCPRNAKYCIKYESELTTVRDCVETCSEKEWWGARTFCCNTDECNAASTLGAKTTTLFILAVLPFAVFYR